VRLHLNSRSDLRLSLDCKFSPSQSQAGADFLLLCGSNLWF
jgi:hypothetical protein